MGALTQRRGFRADAARGRFRATGAGRGTTPALPAGECTPHSLFGLAKKRMGRARSKRKKRRAVGGYGRSPASLCPRRGLRVGFGASGHPLRPFPLALLWECQGSVSGAWRAGFSSTTSDDRRSVNAGKTDSRDGTGVRRWFGGSGHPLRRLPPALHWERRGSVSGAWRAGFTSTTSVDRRSVHAEEADSRDENSARR